MYLEQTEQVATLEIRAKIALNAQPTMIFRLESMNKKRHIDYYKFELHIQQQGN